VIRQSRLVRESIYPRMVRRIYGTEKPYITVDERKLDQRDLRQIGHALQIIDKQISCWFPDGWQPRHFRRSSIA